MIFLRDVPFSIVKQIPDEFLAEIDPDNSAGDWPARVRFYLYYQGECEAGTCQVSPGGSTGSGGGSSGGGGGGCFLNSLAGALGL